MNSEGYWQDLVEFNNLGATTLNDPPPPWKRSETEGRREGENQRTTMNEVENREEQITKIVRSQTIQSFKSKQETF